MEAVSKKSLEGMQLIPTHLRAEEEHRDLREGLCLLFRLGTLRQGCLFPPDWGFQGRAMLPSSDS